MAPKAKAAAKSPGKAPKKAVEKKEKGERGRGGVRGRPFEVEPTGGGDRGFAGRPGTLHALDQPNQAMACDSCLPAP
jgi:hypothetical protein